MGLVHQIGLTLIKNVGVRQARKLLKEFGSAEAVFGASVKALVAIKGIGKKTAEEIASGAALNPAAEQVAFITKHKIEPLFYTDVNYPQRLKHCYDAPVMLYFKGKANLNHPRVIGVVGTRNATAYGRQLCNQLIEVLQPYGVMVVSGLAYGIDITAHTACLSFAVPTVGVLGHGLDRLYPSLHAPVARQMLMNGGLLTEFIPGTLPDRENFPKRNRIIAGLCDALVVVEASAKGGALITAELANSYFKEVYAFPGRATDRYSEGCNFLIKTHRAALINSAEDLIFELGWEKPNEKEMAEPILKDDSNEEMQRVIAVLKQRKQHIDEIVIRTGISQGELAMILLKLEMTGVIMALPGNFFQLP